jgi:hypothetical protein
MSSERARDSRRSSDEPASKAKTVASCLQGDVFECRGVFIDAWPVSFCSPGHVCDASALCAGDGGAPLDLLRAIRAPIQPQDLLCPREQRIHVDCEATKRSSTSDRPCLSRIPALLHARGCSSTAGSTQAGSSSSSEKDVTVVHHMERALAAPGEPGNRQAYLRSHRSECQIRPRPVVKPPSNRRGDCQVDLACGTVQSACYPLSVPWWFASALQPARHGVSVQSLPKSLQHM